MGGILTLSVFLEQFPEINPKAAGGAESAQRSTNQGKWPSAEGFLGFLGKARRPVI